MKKRIMATALIIFIMAQILLAACSAPSESSGGAPGDISTDTAAQSEPEFEYSYPDVDYEGGEFIVLNVEPVWNFFTHVDYEAMTGESLEDAIYTRNRKLEEKFNYRTKEITVSIDTISAQIKKSVTAADDAYDVVYCNSNVIGPLVTQKMFYNIAEIPEIELDQAWWDQTLTEEGALGANKELYFANNDINIFNLQGTWAIFFNEAMLDRLSLEKPYQLVNDGKWTLDALETYLKAGAMLNGDESFTWKADGASIYGLTSYDAGTAALLAGSGERYIKKDESGAPYFALETERFFNVADKIAEMLGTDGLYKAANDSTGPFNYERMFMANRAMFCGAEIKTANIFREMEDTYGIVPNPKYDEAQSGYHNILLMQVLLTAIPVTNDDVSRVGTILDALAYLSYKEVTPVFYDVTVSQKGLRNQESIEMLKIIRDTRFFDVGIAYGWTYDLYTAVRAALDKGDKNIASLIDKQKSKIQANIEKTMELLNS